MKCIAALVALWAGAAHAAHYQYQSSNRAIGFEIHEGLAAEPLANRRNGRDPYESMGFRLVKREASHLLVPVWFPESRGIGVLTNRVIAGAAVEDLQPLMGSKAILRIERLTNDISVVHTSSPETAVAVGNQLAGKRGIKFAHPVFHFPIEARGTLDPLATEQWHLRNTGQRGGSVGADMKVMQAWTITRGTPDTIIALIDLGFEQNHPDLVQSWYHNVDETPDNGEDDDDNGLIDDVRGWNYDIDSNNLLYGSANSHGTATAGILAAPENGIGVTGVCPNCRVLPIVIYTDIADAVAAFHYAHDQGARVVSNSWGYRIGTPETDALSVTLQELGQEMSILFAMPNFDGNACRGTTPDISAHPQVLAISSVDFHDTKVSPSGFGPCLALVGPSSQSQINAIVTTDRLGERGYNRPGVSYPDLMDQNYTQSFYGTSAATPAVAGVFGLVYAHNPEGTPALVRAQILRTADKVRADIAAYGEDGHSEVYGFGRPNAWRALVE